jgi:hypothetical protein
MKIKRIFEDEIIFIQLILIQLSAELDAVPLSAEINC